jgi:glutamyl-tRNA reductase
VTHLTTLHVRSINHHLAPVEIRELAHLEPPQAIALMEDMCGINSDGGCLSVLPLSTCNRTEIYVEIKAGQDADDIFRNSLNSVGLDPSIFLGEHTVSLDGQAAIEHLFRVASGLESMMIGEPQISSQLKDAYRLAREHHELGPGLLRAFHGAFRAGKRVRSETQISDGAVSVAYAAVELARKFFDKLSLQKATLVGAGETGSLAARHFLQHNIGQLTIVNRSPEKAQELARTLTAEKEAGMGSTARQDGLNVSKDHVLHDDQITVRPWEELVSALANSDVILSTTGATEPVITVDMVEKAVVERKGKPLFMLDIAVPRDIQPAVGDINGVFLFGLDDLDEIIAGNMESRRGQVPHAMQIIGEEIAILQKWLDDVDLRPTVAEFRAYLENLKDSQVGYVRKRENDATAEAVDRSLQQFIKKVLGRSVSTLKSAQSREERERDLKALHHLFGDEKND